MSQWTTYSLKVQIYIKENTFSISSLCLYWLKNHFSDTQSESFYVQHTSMCEARDVPFKIRRKNLIETGEANKLLRLLHSSLLWMYWYDKHMEINVRSLLLLI